MLSALSKRLKDSQTDSMYCVHCEYVGVPKRTILVIKKSLAWGCLILGFWALFESREALPFMLILFLPVNSVCLAFLLWPHRKTCPQCRWETPVQFSFLLWSVFAVVVPPVVLMLAVGLGIRLPDALHPPGIKEPIVGVAYSLLLFLILVVMMDFGLRVVRSRQEDNTTKTGMLKSVRKLGKIICPKCNGRSVVELRKSIFELSNIVITMVAAVLIARFFGWIFGILGIVVILALLAVPGLRRKIGNIDNRYLNRKLRICAVCKWTSNEVS